MLVVDQLAKRFVMHILDEKRIEALCDVSFHVEAGQGLGVAGPSGAGKSSVLKCIYRTYLPTSGSIRFLSRSLGEVDLASADEHTVLQLRDQEIGYVSQFLEVLPRVPAVDVVAEPLIEAGIEPQEARDRARDLLARLRIPVRLFDAYPVTFSGGEQQRVNIARAVIGAPRLLLLDEPTASLDPKSQDIVVELLGEMRAGGSALVAVLHDHSLMRRVTDEIYTMPEPAVVAAGDDLEISTSKGGHA
jgi:alpha-D-ribose 1-methylphosphonate 5-triphosphate synthase subunit PhnL